MNNKATTTKAIAKDFGYLAFLKNRPRIPSLHVEFMSAVRESETPDKEFLGLLDAWLAGWDFGSVRQP